MNPAPGPLPTVWGVGTPRTLRVHWALQELGCAYRTEPVRPRSDTARSPTYRAVNPSGKVPAFTDGAFTLTESGAIVHYVLRRFGAGSGLEPPTVAQELARYDEWASIALMELDATSLYVIRRHVDLREVYGAAPAAVEAARAYAQQAVDRLADRLPPGGCAMGAAFSGADILLTTSLTALQARGVVLPERVAAYVARCTARPAYARALRANDATTR